MGQPNPWTSLAHPLRSTSLSPYSQLGFDFWPFDHRIFACRGPVMEYVCRLWCWQLKSFSFYTAENRQTGRQTKSQRKLKTRSSAIAEGPSDASCQLKSCQLPCKSAETLVRQVLNKSKLWSWRVKVGRCVINMCTQPWRIRVAFIVL